MPVNHILVPHVHAPTPTTRHPAPLTAFQASVCLGQSVLVVVNGNPLWQFQHGELVAHAVTVSVTTPGAVVQPQGKVTYSAIHALAFAFLPSSPERPGDSSD
ncbi:hypothetical protein HJFPF1_09726 [Paramyrothecium foliicola]|nr:hypothetical protein HJFPF1_09726 [Paramyrothecium foliicola]